MNNLPLVPIPSQIREEWEQELHQLLEWWETNMVDHELGGFYGRIDAHNRLHPQADKGVILNARILWSFSLMARNFGRSSYQALADRAFEFLRKYFRDDRYGGLYWTLDAMGRAIADKKQVYAQAFGIYALSEYYRLTKDRTVLAWAMEMFELLEQQSRDPENQGYLEAFTREWEPLQDLRLSHKDRNEAKSMNTHLHLLEAYTHLFRIHPVERVRDRLQELVLLFLDNMLNPKTHHFYLFFSAEWEPRSEQISYGHDIEASWLLCEAAHLLGQSSLIKRCQTAATQIAAATLEGQDLDGGIVNEGEPNGYSDTDKHWWPQFEAMVGFLNAWQISGEERFRIAAIRAWQFAYQFHKDREGGEWHWCLDRMGRPNFKEDKAGPWKAPYHTVRALMEAFRRSQVEPIPAKE